MYTNVSSGWKKIMIARAINGHDEIKTMHEESYNI